MFEAIAESLINLRPWMPWADSHRTVADSLEYIRQCQVGFLLRTDFPMGIFLRSGRYLGGTGIHIRDPNVPSFELGYWIRASAEGQGYVSETVRVLTSYAFETLEAQRVIIRCDPRNARSRRVAERQGFVLEGRSRNFERDPAGDLVDSLTYALIPAEFVRARQLWPSTTG
jgi:ribosomal-protein-serine acetyltransferase